MLDTRKKKPKTNNTPEPIAPLDQHSEKVSEDMSKTPFKKSTAVIQGRPQGYAL